MRKILSSWHEKIKLFDIKKSSKIIKIIPQLYSITLSSSKKPFQSSLLLEAKKTPQFVNNDWGHNIR